MTDGALLLFSPLNDPRRPALTRLAELEPNLLLLLEETSAMPAWAQSMFGERVVRIRRLAVDQAVASIRQALTAWNQHPAGIVCLSETGLYFCAELATALGLPFASPQVLEAARDKSRMRQTFADHGLPTVRFGSAGDVAEACQVADSLGYPVVLKPLLAGGSLYVRTVHDRAELTEVFEETLRGGAEVVAGDPLVHATFAGGSRPRLLVEQLIGGQRLFDSSLDLPVGEVSAEGCVIAGQVHVLAHHDKPLPANGPFFEEVLWSSPSRLDAAYLAQVDALAGRAALALGLDNTLFHAEMRTTPEGPVLLEVAARMGGGPIFRSALLSGGVDLIQVMAALARGDSVPPAAIRPRELARVMTFGLFAESGMLAGIEGLDAVRAHPSVIEACVYEHPGTLILRAPKSDHCTVHVMVAAADFERAEEVGRYVARTVRFVRPD